MSSSYGKKAKILQIHRIGTSRISGSLQKTRRQLITAPLLTITALIKATIMRAVHALYYQSSSHMGNQLGRQLCVVQLSESTASITFSGSQYDDRSYAAIAIKCPYIREFWDYYVLAIGFPQRLQSCLKVEACACIEYQVIIEFYLI